MEMIGGFRAMCNRIDMENYIIYMAYYILGEDYILLHDITSVTRPFTSWGDYIWVQFTFVIAKGGALLHCVMCLSCYMGYLH